MKEVKSLFSSCIEVDKSKFYAFLFPLKESDKFKEFLKDLKKEHKRAKHFCYAYVIGTSYKSNDDGEPKGTAGRPLLELLLKKDITNTGLIVVRYFGGTKLGASRLLRTYVSSGVEVINKAEFKEV